MSVFAIALLKPHSGVAGKIRENHLKHYEYSSTLFLVEADVLAEGLAISAGIKGANRFQDASGFVIKLEEFSYSGYTSRALWEWLREVGERA